MDQFKLKQGISPIYPITEKKVETVLGRKEPYYQKNKNGGNSYYAVCPACENPIQIIGIFRNTVEAGRKPYGRHAGKSIPALAEHNQADYYDCPYSNKNWSAGQKRHANSRIETQFLSLLKEQFDRVIYILEKDIDIHISSETARKMLRSYLANQGWSYRDATPNNLPWKFAQTEQALPLFGRKIKVDSPLAQAISENCPEVTLVPSYNPRYVQVKASGSDYVDLWYFLHSHRVSVIEEHLTETITFRVYRGNNREKAIFEKEIVIQTEYFMNLISLPEDRSKRNRILLNIAAEEIN